jgi:hypothetical protein
LHPEIPAWVAQEFTTDWRPIYRIPAMLHPEASPPFVAIWRIDALHDALSGPRRGYNANDCPGVFYFVLRDLPNALTGTKISINNFNIAPGLPSRHFLVRLAVAMRLDDAVPEQRALRETLVDDPNRYVRAAARREIVWPNPARRPDDGYTAFSVYNREEDRESGDRE